jgi:glycosyltransferase involved in cell wall biosynthesis
VIFVNYVYSPDLHAPNELLEAYFELTGWVHGLISAGVRVSVFQRFHSDDLLRVNGAEYYFVSDNLSPAINSYQVPLKLHREISKYIGKLPRGHEDIVLHINGLLFPLQVLHLKLTSPRKCSIVVQHHAEPPRKGVARFIQKICLWPVDGFLFSTLEHAKVWIRAGIIHPRQLIGEIMEISSNLRYGPRTLARQRTGFTGHPILLWTGNLNQNKDPITVLEGLKRILEIEPDTRLYMAYRYDDLLADVKNHINSSEVLMTAVSLIGAIPYSDIESTYNSADFFVQGSHKESGGIALADALACGVIPVVTDIPSFRVMTDNGHIGALWVVGDPQAFAEALLLLVHSPIDQLSLATKKHFENNFSFEKIGEQASVFYKKVTDQKPRLFK